MTCFGKECKLCWSFGRWEREQRYWSFWGQSAFFKIGYNESNSTISHKCKCNLPLFYYSKRLSIILHIILTCEGMSMTCYVIVDNCFKLFVSSSRFQKLYEIYIYIYIGGVKSYALSSEYTNMTELWFWPTRVVPNKANYRANSRSSRGSKISSKRGLTNMTAKTQHWLLN